MPSDRCEKTDEGRRKLDEFKSYVQKKMCRFWDSRADLGSQVSRSLVKLIKTHPGVGWVRGDIVPDSTAAEEILRLRKRIEELETGLQAARVEAPEGTATLSQGEEEFTLAFSFKATPTGYHSDRRGYSHEVDASWNEIFAAVSPLMINEASDSDFRAALTTFVQEASVPELREDESLKTQHLVEFEISEDSFQTVKVQLRALGLIGKGMKPRSVKDVLDAHALRRYGHDKVARHPPWKRIEDCR